MLIEEKRGKRIASFLEKAMEDAKMEIPLLSYSFRYARFINLRLTQDGEKSVIWEVDVNEAFASLTIGMIRAKELEVRNMGLPQFPRR